MKTIKSIRVDEQVHIDAKAQATAKGMTLSGYIKSLINKDK